MTHPLFILALFVTLITTFFSVHARPEPVLRTVEEAIARLERDVLDTMRQRDELTAYLMRPSGGQQDSIHMPPTIITSWEGDSVQIDVPSYVFLLDLEPTMLWTHPVVIVVVPAVVGPNARTQQHWISGPVLVNGTLMDVGPMCGANPNRVRGLALPCTKVDSTELLPTARTDARVYVVVGKHVGDADSIGFRHDVQQAALRLNWSILGPQLHEGTIKIIDGEDGKGASRQDLNNAFSQLDGGFLQRYFITYIGHATQHGPMLSDGGASWTEFAEYISLAPTGSASVEVVTNYSGRIIPSLLQAGVRGSVLTATDTLQRIHYRTTGASDWQRALTTLFDNETFDVNQDKVIGHEEIIPYVTSELPADDPVVLAKPMFRDLIDTTVNQGRTTSTPLNMIQPFQVTLRKSYVDGKTITSVYAINSRYFPIETHDPYELVSQRDSAGTSHRTVIATVQPVIPMRSEIWLADLPDSCYGVAVRMFNSNSARDTTVDAHYGSISAPRETWYRTQHPLVGGVQDVSATAQYENGYSERMLISPLRFTIPAKRTVNITLSDRTTSRFHSPNGVDFSVTGSDRTRQMFRVRAHELLQPRSDTSITYGSRLSIEAFSGDLSIDSLQTSEVHLAPGRIVACTAGSVWLHTVALFARPQQQSHWRIGSADLKTRCMLNTINVNGLDSVVIATPTISAQHVVTNGTPIIIHDLTTATDLGFMSLFNSPSPAFRNTNTIGATDTVRIHDLSIIDADSLQMELLIDGIIECTDCAIDLARCRVIGTGRLEQRQNLSALVRTESGEPLQGSVVHILSQQGDTLATAITDIFGHARPDSVLIGTLEEGGLTNHAPIRVLYRDQAGTLHEQVAPHTRRAQVLFVDRSVSSVHEPPAPYTIAPNPVHIGEEVRITGDEMIEHVDLYAIDGTQIATLTPNAVQVIVSTSSLTPGTYICRVTTQSATRAEKIILLP